MLSWALPLAAQETKNIPLVYQGYSVQASVYTGSKTIKAQADRGYFWFRSKEIHYTQGGYEGRLLHGAYTEFYRNNQLRAKGLFHNGLKKGEWKQWYENGRLKETAHWKNGKLHGTCIRYDENGNQVFKAAYRHDKYHGKVTELDSSGAVRVHIYRKGVEKIKTPRKSRRNSKQEVLPLSEETKTEEQAAGVKEAEKPAGKPKKEKRHKEKPKATEATGPDKSEKKAATKKTEEQREKSSRSRKKKQETGTEVPPKS